MDAMDKISDVKFLIRCIFSSLLECFFKFLVTRRSLYIPADAASVSMTSPMRCKTCCGNTDGLSTSFFMYTTFFCSNRIALKCKGFSYSSGRISPVKHSHAKLQNQTAFEHIVFAKLKVHLCYCLAGYCPTYLMRRVDISNLVRIVDYRSHEIRDRFPYV